NEMQPDKAVVSNASDRLPIKESNIGSKLGFDVQPVTDQFARANEIENSQRGLQVVTVDQAGPAAGKLSPGSDIITHAWPSGDAIRTTADLQKVLAGKRKG